MHRQASPLQLLKQASQFRHGAAAHGDRSVTTGPAHVCLHPANLFFRDHDRVELLAAEVKPGAAELPQGIADAFEKLRVGLHEILGPP